MREIIVNDSDSNPIIGLAQWDNDVMVYISDDEITQNYNVHFCNSKSSEAYVVNSNYKNNVLSAKIPNILLQEPLTIIGYVYSDKNEELKSILYFRISVRSRPKPSNFVYVDTKDYIDVEDILYECKRLEQICDGYKEESKNFAEISKSYSEKSELSASQSSKSADIAKAAEGNAKTYSDNANASALNATQSESNAKLSADNALNSETNAKTYSDNANISAANAAQSESNAKISENNALSSENAAKQSEDNAKVSEDNASQSKTLAASSASSASNFEKLSESYCHGNTNVRSDEDIDNAKYYCERSKLIYESISTITSIQMAVISSETRDPNKPSYII